MAFETYKILHMTGLSLLFLGLGTLLGVYSTGHLPEKKWRISLAVVHGLGMALILVSGFGMLARLGLVGAMPGWVFAKIGIWLVFGASMVLAKRQARLRLKLIGFWVALVAAAAYIAIFKPF